MNEFRPSQMIDGTPLQQSMLSPGDHKHNQLFFPVLGVVLEVHPSDDSNNRSAWQRADRLGHQHECTVLVTNDGAGGYFLLKNVMIASGLPTGIDNFSEYLPRASTQALNGQEANLALHDLDTCELDGDWCIVQFIGGSLNQPYISTWFPHPRNTLDPATNGTGVLDSNNRGTTLVQAGRFFQRMNGVEYVITRKGDIYLSTRFSNSRLLIGEDPVESRFARSESDEGGSVSINVKPGQILEINFNPEVDGVGIYGAFENDLPQTNPRSASQAGSRETDHTILHLDEESFFVEVPDEVRFTTEDVFKVESATSTVEAEDTITLDSDDSVSISGTNSVTINGQTVKLGANATEAVIKGNSLNTQLTAFLTGTKALATALKAEATLSAASKSAAEALEGTITSFLSSLNSLLSQKVKVE